MTTLSTTDTAGTAAPKLRTLIDGLIISVTIALAAEKVEVPLSYARYKTFRDDASYIEWAT